MLYFSQNCEALYVDSLAVLFYGPNSASFLFIFVFQTQIYRKTVGLSGIRTRIVGAEAEHADDLTTTTTALTNECLKNWNNRVEIMILKVKDFKGGVK